MIVWVVYGRQWDHLNVGIVGVDGERVAAAHGQLDAVAHRYRLEYLDHVLVRVAEHTLVVDVDEHVALHQAAVAIRRTVGHHVLYLQKVLARLVGADYGEAEAVCGFEQRGLQEVALQFVRILGEEDVATIRATTLLLLLLLHVNHIVRRLLFQIK